MNNNILEQKKKKNKQGSKFVYHSSTGGIYERLGYSETVKGGLNNSANPQTCNVDLLARVFLPFFFFFKQVGLRFGLVM